MTDSVFSKIFLIAIYLGILLLVPLFLDYLYKVTIRRNNKKKMESLAKKEAAKLKKPLIIFNGTNSGTVDTDGTVEKFDGDVFEIVSQLRSNTSVIMVSETLEYIPALEKFIKELERVSGGNLYILGIEKNSPRIFWDYKILNVLDQSYITPQNIKSVMWESPNGLQQGTHAIYEQVFKILPYDTIVQKMIN